MLVPRFGHNGCDAGERHPVNLIAHRGGAGLRVENTLAAFANAVELGADGAELDVHLTRDGCVVVHHNHRLNGAYCRNKSGMWLQRGGEHAIADLTAADLRDYEIGVPDPASTYAREFDRIVPVRGQGVPLLRDVVELVKAKSDSFLLVVEIKASILGAGGKAWRALVGATLEIMDEEGFADRTILCSFDWGALLYARGQRPGLKTWFTSLPLSWLGDGQPPDRDLPPAMSYLEALRAMYGMGDAPWFAGFDPRRFGGSFPEAIAAAGGNAWLMYYRDYSDQARRELARCGLESAAWSVNLRDEKELARLVRTGVDNLLVDYPDVDLKALA